MLVFRRWEGTGGGLGADHGGVVLKDAIAEHLRGLGHDDRCGDARDDGGLPGHRGAEGALAVADASFDRGILVCGNRPGNGHDRQQGVRKSEPPLWRTPSAPRWRWDITSACSPRAARAWRRVGVAFGGWLQLEGGRQPKGWKDGTKFGGDMRSIRIRSCDHTLMAEYRRQQDELELIASENYASPAVIEAMGSVLTNKYAEVFRDVGTAVASTWTRSRRSLGNVQRISSMCGANVQPHSGAQANASVFWRSWKPGRP